MSWKPRKHVCSGCGRHRSLAFLKEVPGKMGLYCKVCRRAMEPKPKKEGQ